ncbi:beta-1,3-glucosyltransferase [Bradysia coprophila]|uniref:beta-1,3-glucosyltransferase n=1 Tax=Bradysia coprophila TaxID=38358 RepID=UPI00187DB66C|nr:beta-1,3-glucosyltransferase [Bradysia coprophila]XP_037042575.1 beta-1,3-glucosyltransferase [Bradysia coprophila]XP_037042576.1 beta-1,3-glucosyltransferase [Bradysia coprophila]
MSLIAIYWLAFVRLSLSLAPHELTILIRSQSDLYNRQFAIDLKEDILQQTHGLKPPQIYLTHETFNHGSWAITPLLVENLRKIFTSETKWLILCEDQSGVDLTALVDNLNKEDFSAEAFMGYPLMDKEATIIHHFAFFENPSWFLYPLLKAGVAITIPLLNRLLERLNNEKFSTEFFIDASHEFSLFVWNNGNGHKLTSAPYFCQQRKIGCAIYSKPYATCDNKWIPNENILFAVKTCSKFHFDRVPVIQSTWRRDVKLIRFYSDVTDSTIPTINTLIPNTEAGHCDKALSIFDLILKEISSNASLSTVKWVVLSDDDTLISVRQLQRTLSCYDSYDGDLYLGERYGYRLLSPDGFNYITGGGGIVFSLSTINKLINRCSCPTSSAPDDMIIGICLKQLGIEPIHSSLFHQARPTDYSEELLTDSPISFHKFWQIDPYEVYSKWFRNTNETEINTPTCTTRSDIDVDLSTIKHVDL